MNGHSLMRCASLTFAITSVTIVASPAVAQPAVEGDWIAALGDWNDPIPGLPEEPLRVVHADHLPTGQLLLWMEEGEDCYLWEPSDGDFIHHPYPTILYCPGHVGLSNGDVLAAGGLNDPSFIKTRLFKLGGSWEDRMDMHIGRFYPSNTTLPNGHVLACGGNGATPRSEIYDPDSDTWTLLSNVDPETWVYPFTFVIPDGNVAVVGGIGAPFGDDTWVLDLESETWSTADSSPFIGEAGSAVMFDGRVLKAGGLDGSLPVNDASIINFNDGTPVWGTNDPSMVNARTGHNPVLLPDGHVLAIGGWNGATPVLKRRVV